MPQTPAGSRVAPLFSRARWKRWLIATGWLLYLIALLYPVRGNDGSLHPGAGLALALVAPQIFFTVSITRMGSLISLVALTLPNVAVLTTPFAYRRRFSEHALYRAFLICAAVDALLIAGTLGQQTAYIRGTPELSIAWACAVTLIALGFLVDRAAVSAWPWLRTKAISALSSTVDAISPLPSTGAFEFDVFISYSSRADYKLVRSLESFLETFHEIRVPGAQLRRLQVCTDISDFRLAPREGRRESLSPSTAVANTIDRYLAQSEYLLVLCCPKAVTSDWVGHEIRWFLEHDRSDYVLLAVTGGDPVDDAEHVFPTLVRDRNHHRSLYYDLRRAYWKYRIPGSRAKNWDDERVRLAAELAGGMSGGQVRPIWFRSRRKRRLRAGLAAGAGLVLAMIISLKFGELSLRNDAFDYSDDTRRLRAIYALTRWYDYSPEKAQRLVVRDNPEQLFHLLTAGCSANLTSVADRVPLVAAAVDTGDIERRGVLLAALNQAARVAPAAETARFDRVEGFNTVGEADLDIDDFFVESPPLEWLDISVPPGTLWISKQPLPREGQPERFTAFEAFQRAAVKGERLPTPAELLRAYKTGLEILDREWCRYESGSEAPYCHACLMVGGEPRHVPFFSPESPPELAYARAVTTNKKE